MLESHDAVDDAVGTDLGVEAHATLSSNDRIPNIGPASRREREIRRLRRALARCRRGSNRRRKARAKLGRQLARTPMPARTTSIRSRRL